METVLSTFPSKTLVNLINRLVVKCGVDKSWALSDGCKNWEKDDLVAHIDQMSNEFSSVASVIQGEIDGIVEVNFQSGEWL